MRQPKKHLVLCWHGLSVLYDLPPFTSGMPMLLCRHSPWSLPEFKSVKQVINWVETIKQPRWAKSWKLGKFSLSLVKY